MFHNYETEKITCKASDAAENLQLYRVVWSSLTTHHLVLFSERRPIYASSVTISGGRTEQHIAIGFGGLCVCWWVCYHDDSKLRAPILTKLGF